MHCTTQLHLWRFWLYNEPKHHVTFTTVPCCHLGALYQTVQVLYQPAIWLHYLAFNPWTISVAMSHSQSPVWPAVRIVNSELSAFLRNCIKLGWPTIGKTSGTFSSWAFVHKSSLTSRLCEQAVAMPHSGIWPILRIGLDMWYG